MVNEFALTILYTQLFIANPAAPRAVVLWSEEEVAQGFAWDRTQVVFGIPDVDDPCWVRISTGADASPAVADDALWAIAVPFAASGPVFEAGTVLFERPLPIGPGSYQVVFQARPGPVGYAYRLELSLQRKAVPEFAILKQGPLHTGHVLRHQAATSR